VTLGSGSLAAALVSSCVSLGCDSLSGGRLVSSHAQASSANTASTDLMA
jgi:hypothetical protein